MDRVETLLKHLEDRLRKAAPEVRPAAHLHLVGGLVFACRRGALPLPELARRLRDACRMLGPCAHQDPRQARLVATVRSLAEELQFHPGSAEEVLRELELELAQAESAPAPPPGDAEADPEPGSREGR